MDSNLPSNQKTKNSWQVSTFLTTLACYEDIRFKSIVINPMQRVTWSQSISIFFFLPLFGIGISIEVSNFIMVHLKEKSIRPEKNR